MVKFDKNKAKSFLGQSKIADVKNKYFVLKFDRLAKRSVSFYFRVSLSLCKFLLIPKAFMWITARPASISSEAVADSSDALLDGILAHLKAPQSACEDKPESIR